jgi:hypothetical protein
MIDPVDLVFLKVFMKGLIKVDSCSQVPAEGLFNDNTERPARPSI